jgi:hypothetical protein
MTDERIDASTVAMSRILCCPALFALPEKPRKTGGLIRQPPVPEPSRVHPESSWLASLFVDRRVGGDLGAL